MHCTNCGSTLPDNARFCPGCGSAVIQASTPPVSPPESSVQSAPSPRVIPPSSKQSNKVLGGYLVILGLVAVVVIMGWCTSQNYTSSANNSEQTNVASESTDEPLSLPSEPAATERPPATQPPTESPQQRKKEFLQTVDESISGDRITGNPNKFVGQNVDLHGTVVNVLDDSHFNMSTGDVESGNYTVILVETEPGNASNLEANQSIRVIGTVEEPTEGTNAMGGAGEFATVKAEFME